MFFSDFHFYCSFQIKSLISYPKNIDPYVEEPSCTEDEKKEGKQVIKDDKKNLNNGSRRSLNLLYILLASVHVL